MIKSSRIKFVFLTILFIWLILYLIHLYETKDSFQINNLKVDHIQTVSLKYGGKREMIISNQDTIKQLLGLIKKSDLVDWNNINVKSNVGAWDIILSSDNKVKTSLYLINTSFSGAIIQSGDYFYRDDTLLKYVDKLLK